MTAAHQPRQPKQQRLRLRGTAKPKQPCTVCGLPLWSSTTGKC